MTEFRRLEIPDVVEIVPAKHGDHRGFLSEVYKREAFAQFGIEIDWVQENHSFSAEAGTVRGFHFQVPPATQHKLVRVTRGAIFDVAVDLRRGSPSYGRWVGRELSAENWKQLLVPIGFAHGFMTIVPDTEVQYKISAPWSREHERAILWNEPALGVGWPEFGDGPVLSDKDRDAPRLADFDTPFVYEG
jgi:dTDP-4-dehydrorhamnose 3,5-epimerase